MSSYTELRDIHIMLNKKVIAMMNNVGPNKDLILNALKHYKENLYENPDGVAYLDNYNNVTSVRPVYPFSQSEANAVGSKINANTALTQDERDKLIEICSAYEFLMIKIGKKGFTIDEYLNNAITCFKIMGDHIPTVINVVAPDFDRYNAYVAKERGETNYIPLLQLPQVKNYKNAAFLAIKYGTLTIDSQPFNLYIYFGIDDPLGAMNMNSVNPSQSYNTFSSQYLFIKLKEIVGFSYDNISCLLNVFCHEFGHQIGAGGFLFKYYPFGINFSPQSSDILDRVFNKKAIVKAFDENNTHKSQGYDKRSLETAVFGEFLADFIALMVLEKYVDTLADLKSKYDAITSATMWACGANTIDEKHPPKSMRVNIVFLSKKLHNILNTYKEKMNYKSRTLKAPIGKTFGGKRKRNRRITHRRRR
jgi:hypothetical protein